MILKVGFTQMVKKVTSEILPYHKWFLSTSSHKQTLTVFTEHEPLWKEVCYYYAEFVIAIL